MQRAWWWAIFVTCVAVVALVGCGGRESPAPVDAGTMSDAPWTMPDGSCDAADPMCCTIRPRPFP